MDGPRVCALSVGLVNLLLLSFFAPSSKKVKPKSVFGIPVGSAVRIGDQAWTALRSFVYQLGVTVPQAELPVAACSSPHRGCRRRQNAQEAPPRGWLAGETTNSRRRFDQG